MEFSMTDSGAESMERERLQRIITEQAERIKQLEQQLEKQRGSK